MKFCKVADRKALATAIGNMAVGEVMLLEPWMVLELFAPRAGLLRRSRRLNYPVRWCFARAPQSDGSEIITRLDEVELYRNSPEGKRPYRLHR